MNDLLKKIIKLELKTDSGKINYRWGIILASFILSLTAKDWILQIISLIIGAVKTDILNVNVVEKVETANTYVLVAIVIGFFILCFETLYHEDKKKRELNQRND